MDNLKTIYRVVFISLVALLFSCRFENKEQETEQYFEEKFEAQRDSILTMLTSAHEKKIRFIPNDTLLELPSNMNIRLWKNSFLDKDSNIYNGIVNLKIAFITDSSDLLVEQFLTKPHYKFEELKGILKIEVKDEQGNLLLFNPNYSTSIWFDPKLRLFSGLGWNKDSMNNAYYKPIEITQVFRLPLEDHNPDDSLVPDYLIDLSITSDNELNKGEKVNHKGAMMTKKEVIGYELTIKGNGFYYISRQDRQENLQETNIVVQLETDLKDFEAIVLLYNYDEGWSYFLHGEQINTNQYKITPPDGQYKLLLPLNKMYTVLAYFIKDEKVYFGKTPNITLHQNSLINITISETEIEEMIKKIQEM